MKNSLLLLALIGLLSQAISRQACAQAGSGLISMAASGQTPDALASDDASQAAVPAPTAVNPDSVYINPEVRPQFVGGDRAFVQYLMKSIRYPEQALQRRVSGRVFVSFVLSATGKVQDAHVVSGPGSGLNEEALRLIWTMPAWEPGRVNGQPVRVACTLPINFNTGR